MKSQNTACNGPAQAKEIDRLGRVVIPADIRQALGLGSGGLVNIRLDPQLGAALLTAAGPCCTLCGGQEGLAPLGQGHICALCRQAAAKLE